MARPSKDLTVRVGSEEYDALRAYAAATGASINEVVVDAIREFLAGPVREQRFDSALTRVREDYREALDTLGQT